jgi:hypothetical protein
MAPKTSPKKSVIFILQAGRGGPLPAGGVKRGGPGTSGYGRGHGNFSPSSRTKR